MLAYDLEIDERLDVRWRLIIVDGDIRTSFFFVDLQAVVNGSMIVVISNGDIVRFDGHD